ncbi:hypothetical protein SNE40_016652 [Patella caerulea]|uniref:receptor protein-tyrosine kinase n=1 Tax=Patella caerulea TaxID=87958 RepID=A0AAN8J9N9_PATCE
MAFFLLHPLLLVGFTHVLSFDIPSVTLFPTTKQFKSGRDIKLKCKGSNFQKSTKSVVFERQYSPFRSVPISESSKYKLNIQPTKDSDVTLMLTIRKVNYSDSGDYKCTVSDSFNEVGSETITVQVEGVPEISNFGNEVGEGILGNRLELNCPCESYPPPLHIKWLNSNGKTIESSNEYGIEVNQEVFSIRYQAVLIVYSLTNNILGNYTCQITNIYGAAERIFTVRAKPSLEIIEPLINGTTYFIGENISIRCRSINIPETPKMIESVFNEEPRNRFLWRFTPYKTKGQIYLSVSKDRNKLFEIDTELEASIMMSHSTLTLWKAEFKYQGRYICARMINNRDVKAYIDIEVKGAPTVTTHSSELAVLPGQTCRLHCNVIARPEADDVEWFEDDIPIDTDRRRYDIISSTSDIYQSSTLIIKRVKIRDYSVQYSCRAENELGATGLNLRLKDVNECETGLHNCSTEEGFICRDIIGSFACDCKHGYVQDRGSCKVLSTKSAKRFAVSAGVSVVVIVVAVIFIVVLVRFFRKKRKQGATEPMSAHNIATYNISNNSNMTTNEPCENLQIDLDTFPRSRLKFLNKLGEGKFGKVLKAEALSISKSGMWETVAVKMWKDSSTDGEKEDFYNELVIMKKIPTHHNVVSFLGLTPAEGSNSALMIMEYVPGGNLLTYLRKLRSTNLAKTSSTEPSLHSQLSPKELLQFSHQIAKGMVHIASLHIVHRDVAARNILIGENNICKISDFGLARETEGTDEYERCTKGPLPIRWMSVESLRDNLHTIKSDVWSYGVCLWEIATLGASPYPGKSAQMAMESILAGDRLECPIHCKHDVYDIMESCWADDASCRPSFEDLVLKIEGLLEDEGEYMILHNFDEQVYSVIDDVRHEERL